MKYVRSFFICAGIWFIASLVNGLLCTISFMIFDNTEVGVAGLSFLFSFIFSAPLVAMLWLVTIIAQLSGQQQFELFKTMLITAMLCALTGAVFFIKEWGNEFDNSKYAVGFSVIFSATAAVLLFRTPIKENGTSAMANNTATVN